MSETPPGEARHCHDCFGREIQPGDVIAYPARKGAETLLRLLRVVELDFTWKYPRVCGYFVGPNGNQRYTRMWTYQRSVIINREVPIGEVRHEV